MTVQKPSLRTVTALLAASLFAVSAQATIFENDAVITPRGDGQWLTLSKSISSAGGQGLFAIDISRRSATSFDFNYVGIAEAYALYEAHAGDVLDSIFVSTHQPLVTNFQAPFSSTQEFQLNETKVFAYWDNAFLSRPEIYGWVNITLTASGLVATNGASSLGSGIVVGTTTAVPEPASAMLFLLGGTAAMLAIARQRKLKAATPTSPDA